MKMADCTSFRVKKYETEFTVRGKIYTFRAMLPPDAFYEVDAVIRLMEYLSLPIKPAFPNFVMPPGRGMVFDGKKNMTLVDSSYNANGSSMTNMLTLFSRYPAKTKWLVLGDMLEQGEEEREEHAKLAPFIATVGAKQIILMGTRITSYTYPILAKDTWKKRVGSTLRRAE